ncbi:uncharacterized protein F4812DRAFT_310918 [Daldinia caldariorum]|uniref:uncharacterized protein n=1 Tax=Daldinia caldariorum TaxID=326644 RepID=UPI002008CB70|nr:uncharacterized protein F4812DRAFT_310918 [Daldinia caldariorum]KAI1470042.1 hypothetical protein F4812DRAFT_310918 [Daldinia caldariorum]
MAFLEDPRLRQRWNQISHTTETVTENAAAGIWSFGHTYVTPCLSSISSALESCSTVCLGDREERARRARERQRARGRAEYSFDFYDDWDEELGGGDDPGGLLGSWRGEDWDQLLAGTGKKRSGGDIQEQPRRKRGMSYGTKPPRRRSSIHEDPTIIPSTAPLGFLGRLPFKIGGTLRYKPSAANLQEHPGASRSGLDTERLPLLGGNDNGSQPNESHSHSRKRSGTVGSGDTSDSYRSRGDLFPSDEEGGEDAIPLDDEFTIALDHVDDRESNKTRSSKGKRIADCILPRSVSRTTINSTRPSLYPSVGSGSVPESPALLTTPSLEDLRREDERAEREENELIEKKRQVAADLALRRGLSRENLQIETVPEAKSEIVEVEQVLVPHEAVFDKGLDYEQDETGSGSAEESQQPQAPDSSDEGFVPARLPYFR